MLVAPTALPAAMVLLFGTGCSEAVHTLGTLPLDTSTRTPCKNATTPSRIESNRSTCGAGEDTDASIDGRRSNDGGALLSSGGGNRGGGGGNSGNATTNGGSGGANGGGGSSIGTCVAKRVPASRRAASMLLLVDNSLSVVLQPVWTNLTDAISRFVDDPANTGVGVGIEYYGLTCPAADYANPVVPIAALPGNAASIKGSYPPLPLTGKAIAPAMRGATSYVRSVLGTVPDRAAVLVLVTDGVLDPLCGSTATSAADEAHLGTQGTPPVKTYVVALGAGPTLLHPGGTVDLSPLDDIAAAGGTGEAARVEVNASTNAELTSALDAVAARAACAYAMPGAFDTTRVELEFQPDGAAAVRWPRVPDEAGCQGQLGVFQQGSADILELCPASCTALTTNPSASVSAVEPCSLP